MTREEAIAVFKGFKFLPREMKAVDMAIEALEQEPCADAISRQAVLIELDKYLCGVPFEGKGIDKVIKELPPVKPTEKVGQWIDTDNYYQRWKCSECGCHTRDARPNYCSNCGAKMQASPTGAESEVQNEDSD